MTTCEKVDQSVLTLEALDSFSELEGDISSISPSVVCRLHSTTATGCREPAILHDQVSIGGSSKPLRDNRINQLSIQGIRFLVISV